MFSVELKPSIAHFTSNLQASKMTLKITNMTGSFKVEGRIDFDNIFDKCEWSGGKIDEETFAVRRFRSLKKTISGVTFLIFESGAIVMIGAKSRTQALAAADQLMDEFKWTFKEQPSFSNIVGSCDFERRMRLWDLKTFLKNNKIQKCDWCEINEDVFPALRVRVDKKKKPVFLIFPSGKVIITGCKRMKILQQHHLLLLKLIKTWIDLM